MHQSLHVLPKIARGAVIVALCLSLGAHWIALQSVAWGAMIVEYSQKAPLAEAVAKTFDGAHPCNLCRHISSAQQSEKKHDAQSLPKKPDLICATRTIVLTPPHTNFSFAVVTMSLSTLVYLPAIPPPRSELA